MQELKIRPRIQDFELNMIEEIFEKPIPAAIREFLKKYAGTGVYESVYIDKNNQDWQIGQFILFKDLFGLSKEFLDKGWGKKLPFAYDDGGWHFCHCMDDKDYGSIFINRWTDHLPEDQFLKIADSFEDFINGLKREDQTDG